MDTRRYNDQIRYIESDLTVGSMLSDKNSILHKRMYDVALSKLLESIGLSGSDCSIKEIPAKSFLDPSSVIISLSKFPFDEKTYSLSEFWPEYILSRKMSSLPGAFLEAPSEIISKDFVSGRAKVQNRFTSETITMPLDIVPGSIGLSETIDLDNLTFSSKMNQDTRQ